MKRFLLATACSAAIGLSALPGHAEPFGAGLRTLSEKIAEALSVHGLGRDGRVAEIYVRPPFDETYRVVCAPLSRRLARALRAELPEALARKRLTGARTVQRQGDGPGQLILNVSWRQSGADAVEIGFLLGDLTSDRVADLGGGAVQVDRSGLGESERACLAELDVINRLETAKDTLFVHRSANIFSPEIGTIAKGERYRLLGRMPYTDGDWAVVKLNTATGDPFAENVGFASVLVPGKPAVDELATSLTAQLAEAQAKIAALKAGQVDSDLRLGEAVQSADHLAALLKAAEAEVAKADAATSEEKRKATLLNEQVRELQDQLSSLQRCIDTEKKNNFEQAQAKELGMWLNSAISHMLSAQKYYGNSAKSFRFGEVVKIKRKSYLMKDEDVTSKILPCLAKNTTVQIIGKGARGWYFVANQGESGFLWPYAIE